MENICIDIKIFLGYNVLVLIYRHSFMSGLAVLDGEVAVLCTCNPL